MVDHLFQRQQQHAAHRNPAGNNHRDHQQHHRRKDPQNAFVVAFIVLDTFGGQRGLRLTPLAINLLHRGLLLFGILFEHIFQIALPQQNVHLRQRGGVDAVLLFRAIGGARPYPAFPAAHSIYRNGSGHRPAGFSRY